MCLVIAGQRMTVDVVVWYFVSFFESILLFYIEYWRPYFFFYLAKKRIAVMARKDK